MPANALPKCLESNALALRAPFFIPTGVVFIPNRESAKSADSPQLMGSQQVSSHGGIGGEFVTANFFGTVGKICPSVPIGPMNEGSGSLAASYGLLAEWLMNVVGASPVLQGAVELSTGRAIL